MSPRTTVTDLSKARNQKASMIAFSTNPETRISRLISSSKMTGMVRLFCPPSLGPTRSCAPIQDCFPVLCPYSCSSCYREARLYETLNERQVKITPFYSSLLNPNFEDDYFSVALISARRKLIGLRDSLVASSVWRPEFKKSLETCPEFNLFKLDFALPQCDACHLGGRLSTLRGQLGGSPYDPLGFQVGLVFSTDNIL